MHAPRQPRPVLATLVMPDEGQDVQESGGTDAVTEARRVVEPDLLWIESVTDRLLGTAGRPAAWERVYFEGRETAAPAAGDEPPAAEPHADESAEPRATEPDVGEQPAAGPDDEPLPQRAPRVFGGPVSYRQPAGYVPPASVDVLTMPPPVDDPAAPSDDHDVSEADPEHQEPPLSAEPSPDLAPTGPHLEQVPAPSPSLAAGSEPSPEPATSETSRTEEMPPAVLRAALRDALPDALSAPVASGPADAVFGDPRWSLPPEEAEEPEEVAEVAGRDADATDQPDEVAVDLTGEDTDRLRAAAAAEEDAQSFADEPVQEPYFEPAAPARPRTPPTYADLGYGFPRPADQLTVADVALRLAFRSEDRELAEAVVRLVARQARERSRLQTAEAYLDAILDEGDAALPGAARLRGVLAD